MQQEIREDWNSNTFNSYVLHVNADGDPEAQNIAIALLH